METRFLREIKDIERLKEVKFKITPLVDGTNHLSTKYLEKNDWLAIPVEHPIDYPDAEWITEAVYGLGISMCYAISTESDAFGYEFELSQNSLLEFRRACSLQHFLIVPNNLSFAILDEGDYYFIVAGSRNFCRQAIGVSFKTAHLMFREYAQSEPYGPAQEFLLELLKRYGAFNGLLAE